jgi:hypothetical protein
MSHNESGEIYSKWNTDGFDYQTLAVQRALEPLVIQVFLLQSHRLFATFCLVLCMVYAPLASLRLIVALKRRSDNRFYSGDDSGEQ